MAKRKKAQKSAKKRKQVLRPGFFGTLLILALLTAVGLQLYALNLQVSDAQAQRDALAAQVDAMRQKNDALSADIDEGCTPEKMKEIARRELGLVLPGEYVFNVGS